MSKKTTTKKEKVAPKKEIKPGRSSEIKKSLKELETRKTDGTGPKKKKD
ncbi:MAG: hypothetical protein V1903_14005 [Bacteroidota bacterium]